MRLIGRSITSEMPPHRTIKTAFYQAVVIVVALTFYKVGDSVSFLIRAQNFQREYR